MDSKELRGLAEAYSEVYAPQQIDEVLDTPEKANEYAGKNVKSMVGAFAKGVVNKDISQLKTIEKRKRGAELAKRKAERKVAEEQNEEVEQIDEISAGLAGKVVNARIAATGAAIDRENKYHTPQNVRDTVAAADKEAKARKLAAGVRSRRTKQNEEFDIFDIVLEFLQVEGYAETLEEAEWIMANELDSEDIEEILEAEGSYGKTPKASAAYSALVRKRTNKPASEYSKKGEKTKKVKSAEKHMWRSLRGGPHHGRGKMTADDRTERRSERAFDLETSYGSGSVTKNPKKLRKQKAMGEHD
jgi:hypothetical protein